MLLILNIILIFNDEIIKYTNIFFSNYNCIIKNNKNYIYYYYENVAV